VTGATSAGFKPAERGSRMDESKVLQKLEEMRKEIQTQHNEMMALIKEDIVRLKEIDKILQDREIAV
jgi:hypothetical protein